LGQAGPRDGEGRSWAERKDSRPTLWEREVGERDKERRLRVVFRLFELLIF
jgi:hypothetical protein